LLGALGLTSPDGLELSAVLGQRKRFALLAYLAVASPRGFHSRDTVVSLFWPERDAEHARAALNRAAYYLRHALGAGVLISRGDEQLGLAREMYWCDVVALEESLGAGRTEEGLALYRGALLDGFFVHGAPGFERWLESERDRVARVYTKALEIQAEAREAEQNHAAAVECWRRLAAHEPHSSRIALRLMRVLEAVGDRAGALQHARMHTALLRQEFGAEPDPTLVTMEERLRRPPTAAGVMSQAAPAQPPGPGPAPAASPDSARTAAPSAAARRFMLTPRRLGLALATALALGGAWWTRHRVRGDPTHIDALAVLPLANLTGSAEQEYFVEGMHDALIGELGQISILTVTSRTTVLRYRNTGKSVPEIARELHVDAVVEGSVFRAGDSVRIHVQLIRAAPRERQLWAQTYDGDLRNVLTLQKGVARAIAEQIRATLTPQERARLAAVRPVDPAAYDAWAKGWFQLTRLTGGTQRTCLEHATRAVELDPTYAAAHALMAACYNLLTYLAESAPRDVFPRAKAAARKALALDETLPDAHFALASALAAYDWDWAGAEREYQRGLELNPSSAYGHSAYGWFLSWMGRHDDALAQVRRAQDLNPANPLEIQRTAAVLYVGRRYDDAVAEARRAIEIDSTLLFGYDRLGRAYAEKRMFTEATAAAERAAAVSGHTPNFQASLARIHALSGRIPEARTILKELRDLAQRRYVAPCFIAQVYAALGEKEDALRWLERAYQVRDGDLVLLGVWPAWDPLRAEPRFRDLVRRMKFPG